MSERRNTVYDVSPLPYFEPTTQSRMIPPWEQAARKPYSEMVPGELDRLRLQQVAREIARMLGGMSAPEQERHIQIGEYRRKRPIY